MVHPSRKLRSFLRQYNESTGNAKLHMYLRDRYLTHSLLSPVSARQMQPLPPLHPTLAHRPLRPFPGVVDRRLTTREDHKVVQEGTEEGARE